MAFCISPDESQAQHHSPANRHSSVQDDVYAPFAFLVGEWDIKSADSDSVQAVQRVKWGPNRSYLWYSVALVSDGKEEPHLEGMLMWNGVHKNLDMLFAIDLQSGRSQEQGTISATKDGELVREITAVHSQGVPTTGGKSVGPEGATRQFRQTYRRVGPDKIETAVMRKTDAGWVASFPGSDRWVMTRRSG